MALLPRALWSFADDDSAIDEHKWDDENAGVYFFKRRK